jgi:hypothetical protein
LWEKPKSTCTRRGGGGGGGDDDDDVSLAICMRADYFC